MAESQASRYLTMIRGLFRNNPNWISCDRIKIAISFMKNSSNFLFYVFPVIYNCYGRISMSSKFEMYSIYIYIYMYRGIDAPALIPLNLCDFLRDPKGQL